MNSFVQDLGRFQTSSEKMIAVVNTARNIAGTLSPLVILGETGSGRRELALEIHEHSTRKNGRLLRWTSENFEEEMVSSQDTVVIENIETFSPQKQQKLFSLIASFMDLGLMRSPRWIATGCLDMMTRIRKESFSVRLYQLLATHVLVLPTLSDRGEDLATLADKFVADWNLITGKQKFISGTGKQNLKRINFSNNVSGLFEEIQRLYFGTEMDAIGAETFSFTEDSRPQKAVSNDLVGVTLSEMERRLILQTLEMTKQNRTRAAEILGISIRTLRNKLQEYRSEAEV